LPDETLFSWCSRYHRLAANGLDRTTCLQLFGHVRIGSAHDFPGRIDALVARSKGSLGSAEQVIRDRTLLPFYWPFKPSDLARQSVAAMRGNGIAHLKYRLGLLTSGLGAAHPLKSCPECMQADLEGHGWAYMVADALPGYALEVVPAPGIDNAIDFLPAELADHAPQLVTIEVGINNINYSR